MPSQAHRDSRLLGGGTPGLICTPHDHYYPFFTHGGIGTKSVRGAGDHWTRGWNNGEPCFTGFSTSVAGYIADRNAGILNGGGPFGMNAIWLGAGKPYTTSIDYRWFDSWTSGRPTGWADNTAAGGAAMYTQINAGEMGVPMLAAGRYVCRMECTNGRGIYSLPVMRNQLGTGSYVLYGWIRVNQGSWLIRAENSTATGAYAYREDGVMVKTASNTTGGLILSSEDCNGLWVFFCIRFNYPTTNGTPAMVFYAQVPAGKVGCADLYLPNVNEGAWPSVPTSSSGAIQNVAAGFVMPKGLISNKRFSIAFWMCFPQDVSITQQGASTYPQIIALGNGDYTIHDSFNVFWNTTSKGITLKTSLFGNSTVPQTAAGSTASWKAWEWHHVVLDYDYKNMRFYLDGTLTATNEMRGRPTFMTASGSFSMSYNLTVGNTNNGNRSEMIVSGLVVRSGSNFTPEERESLLYGPVYDPLDYTAISSDVIGNYLSAAPNNSV